MFPKKMNDAVKFFVALIVFAIIATIILVLLYFYVYVPKRECPYGQSYDSLEEVCKNICIDEFTYYYENECVTECPPGTITLFEDAVCEVCPEGELSYNDRCLKTCPSGTEEDPNGLSCQLICKNLELPYYDPLLSECVSLCSAGYAPEPDNGNICTECPSGISFNNICVSSCPEGTIPDPIIADCVVCPGNQYQLENSCVDICPAGTQDIIDPEGLRYCMKLCQTNSTPFYYFDDSLNIASCLASCPPETIETSEGFACSNCPEGEAQVLDPNNMTYSCVTNCPVGTHRNGLLCCTNDQIFNNGICTSNNCTPGTVFDTYKKQCIKCPSSKPNTFENICYDVCPNGLFVQENQCVEACSIGYNTVGNVCNKICSNPSLPIYYYDGVESKCIESFQECPLEPKEFYIYDDVCAICPSENPIYYNGECISQCPSNTEEQNHTCYESGLIITLSQPSLSCTRGGIATVTAGSQSVTSDLSETVQFHFPGLVNYTTVSIQVEIINCYISTSVQIDGKFTGFTLIQNSNSQYLPKKLIMENGIYTLEIVNGYVPFPLGTGINLTPTAYYNCYNSLQTDRCLLPLKEAQSFCDMDENCGGIFQQPNSLENNWYPITYSQTKFTNNDLHGYECLAKRRVIANSNFVYKAQPDILVNASSYPECSGTLAPGYCILSYNEAIDRCNNDSTCYGLGQLDKNESWMETYKYGYQLFNKGPAEFSNDWSTMFKINCEAQLGYPCSIEDFP